MFKFITIGSLLFSCLNLVSNPKEEIDLRNFEKSVYSQQGEDGVIEKIFQVIGIRSKYFVEFGGYDGYGMSNARKLRDLEGWHGLMLDSDFENLAINLQKEFITVKNINSLFQKYNVPYEFDLLSIDIDGNDFYIWNALDEKYRPGLIIIEYNATHLPQEDKVIVYNPRYSSPSINYFGASILAYYNLGRKKGYSLVYAEHNGVNLFFIRDDLIESCNYSFKNINNVEKLYSYPRYGNGPNGGHPQDPYNRPYVKSVDLLK